MKKIAITALVFTSLLSQKALSQTTINGSLNNIKDTIDKVFVQYMNKGERAIDSVEVKNGKYSLSLASITEPTQVSLIAKNSLNKSARLTRKSVAGFFIEPGTITVTNTDSFSNAAVSGSKANLEFEKLTAAAKPYNTQQQELSKKFSALLKEGNKAEAKKVENQIDSLDEVVNEKVYAAYLKNNTSSPLALYALEIAAGYAIDADKISPLFNTLPAEQQNSFSGKAFKAKLDIASKTAIGKYAIDFTQNDTLGKAVSLKDFRGKYVLIDFWASWCGPCRRENPNVVAAFNQFKDKGFHILSVSLDQPGAKEKWIQAIHDDNLTWTHVSDLQFWNNAVAKEYGIQAIPQNLLIDPKGKIIAKNLSGENLANKLKEIL